MILNNKLAFIIISLLIVLGIASYDQSDFTSAKPAKAIPIKPLKPANSFNKKIIPQELLSLNTKPTYTSVKGHLIENLHGRFLNNRAEFYIVKQPKNKIHNSSVTSITLVYLDKNLYKTKYVLASNIVENLINKYGKFTITGYDPMNRDLIATEQLFSKESGKVQLNKNLTNYLLRWVNESYEIIYRVNANTSLYEYTKRRKDYKITLWSIEHSS